MRGTILSGDFTIYHKAENRQMRIEWSGGTTETDTRTMKEWYLALQDYFDEPARMVEGEPMSAQTPTDYTIGIIDPFEVEPWFVDRTTMEHLEGGALQTALWKRTESSNTGIIRLTVNNTNIVAGDIGEDISGDTDSDAGTLLDVKGTGAGSTLWVRPDDDTAANSFDNASQGLTCNTHTATQSAAPDSGESLWAGVFTQGNLETETHLYVYQDGARLTEYKDASPVEDWWEDGHIDKLFAVKEVDALIDEGFVTVLARQFTKSYSYWEVDLSAGGRNAVPVTTGPDINNNDGYKIISTAADHSGPFTIGEEIQGGTSNARGIVTAFVDDVSISYYLIGESITVDFQSGEVITGQESTETATSNGAPAAAGPASLAGLSITHANDNTFDIDEDGTNEYYSIVIDISDEVVADAYPWSQYVLMRGQTGTGNTDGVPAEAYLGIDYRMSYTTLNNTVGEGATVTGVTSGATAVVVAHHLTPKILTLRNTRGTFTATEQVQVDASNYVTNVVPTRITPVAAAPFGTFAGGTWYLAPGCVLDNVPTSDTNKWNTTDDEGAPQQRPTKVSIDITNTRIGDYIALWRLKGAGLDIDIDEYTIDATQGAAPQSTVKVDPAITSDTPASGHIVLRDISTGVEYIHRYTSWTGDVFTLFGAASTTMEATSDEDTIIDTGAFASAQVGDLICNTSRSNAVTYVTEVTSANEVQVAPPITNQTSGDNYVLGYTADYTALTTSDYAYVPFMLVYETAGTDGAPGSESTEITYSSPIPVLLRARNARGLGYNIKPFATEVSIGAAGLAQGVIRNPETIS
jgi:hypothetical protein